MLAWCAFLRSVREGEAPAEPLHQVFRQPPINHRPRTFCHEHLPSRTPENAIFPRPSHAPTIIEPCFLEETGAPHPPRTRILSQKIELRYFRGVAEFQLESAQPLSSILAQNVVLQKHQSHFTTF
jgi:hypothetical protein